MNITIPYGKKQCYLECNQIEEVLTSNIDLLQNDKDQDTIVLEAMAKPIGSKTLDEIALGANTATIIISDHTRPVPSKHIIPHILKTLRDVNPSIKITILVATGCHRGTLKEELVFKLGEEIVQNEEIVVHDCEEESMLVSLGTLPSGAELIINKLAVDCDLLIAEGFIEPHFFAGFSGGRKSVLPGVCSKKTVLGNHCSKFIDDPNARMGRLDSNPIHRDMMEAAKMANLQFIVNVIINEEKEVVAAFAGDAIEAHRVGCDYLASYCKVIPKVKGKIIVTSNGGYPLDQNIYQTVKGLTTAEAAADAHSVIIMCAACNDGIGGDEFYKAMSQCDSVSSLLKQIRATSMQDTIPDQWQYQILARIIKNHKVIYVTDPELKETIEAMKMSYANTLEDALEMAYEVKGRDTKITVIPNGVSLIIGE